MNDIRDYQGNKCKCGKACCVVRYENRTVLYFCEACGKEYDEKKSTVKNAPPDKGAAVESNGDPV